MLLKSGHRGQWETRIDGQSKNCSDELMEAGNDYLAKKRERLLDIINSEPPARKPGARLRTWETTGPRHHESFAGLMPASRKRKSHSS